MRFLRWLLLALLCIAAPASAFWQSRDSNYNTNIVSSGALICSFTPNTAATYNVAYSSGTPSASGGTPTYTFTNSGTSFAASGYTLNASTGEISGTDVVDSGGASYPGIQIVVTDLALNSHNCGTTFTITVAPGGSCPNSLDLTNSCDSQYIGTL